MPPTASGVPSPSREASVRSELYFRLCRALADIYPETEQAARAGLDQADDAAVWRHALREGFVIVTLDSDFAELAALRLRCGNQPTAYIAKLLRDRADEIRSFADDLAAACLELY